jgi:branched-chain amino acid transport system substrate-binding protein
VRFARGSAGAGAANPTEIDFPDLVRGGFDANRPAEESALDDGTTYRLWRMRGDFKNDFALQRYPLDRQTLALRFFNARAASDRLVYVQDRRSLPAAVSRNAASGGAAIAAEAAQPASITRFGDNVSPVAFRNLTQWDVLGTSQRRDILVTESALGNPRLVGIERVRELSGFNMTVELRRRVIATLAKTLLPLGLMALIMFASLYFPPALVKEKVTVAITAALSGAVLLSSINSQLGNVGYVIAVEYGFYVFFTLCLLCIVAVLFAERLRGAGRTSAALAVERSSRYLFLLGFLGTGAAAWFAILHW